MPEANLYKANLYVGNCVKLSDIWHDHLMKNFSRSGKKYSNKYIVVYREFEVLPGNPYILGMTGKITILYNIEHSLERLNAAGGSQKDLIMLYCRVDGIVEIIENPNGQETSGYCTSKITDNEIHIIILKYGNPTKYLVLPYVYMVDPIYDPEISSNFSGNFKEIDSGLIDTIKQCQVWSVNNMLTSSDPKMLEAAQKLARSHAASMIGDLRQFYPFIVGTIKDKYRSSRVERNTPAASSTPAAAAASTPAAAASTPAAAASTPAAAASTPAAAAANRKLQEDLEEARKTIEETNDRIRKLAEQVDKLEKQIRENKEEEDQQKIADLEKEKARIEAEKALAEARRVADEEKAAALEKLREEQKAAATKRDAEHEEKLKQLRAEADAKAAAAAKAAADEQAAKEQRRKTEKEERERKQKQEDEARKLEAEVKEKDRRRKLYVEQRNDLQREIDEIEAKIAKAKAREAEIGIEKEGIRQRKQGVENNIKAKFAELQITQVDIDTLLEYAGEDRGDVIKFKGTKDPVTGETSILYNNGTREFIRKDFEPNRDSEYKTEKGIYEVLSKTPSSFEYVPYYFGSKDTAGGGGRLLLEYVAGITSDKLFKRHITDVELGLVKQGLTKALTVFKEVHLLHLTLNPKNVLIQMDKNTIKGVLLKNFEYSMILKDDVIEGPVTIPPRLIKVSAYYPDDFKEALSTNVNYRYKCLPVEDTDDIDNFALDKLTTYYKTCSKKTQAGVPIPPVADFYDEDSKERIYTLVPKLQEIGAKNKSFEEEEQQLKQEQEKQGLKLKRPRGEMNNLRREYANVLTPVASAAGPAPGASSTFKPGDCVKIVSAPAPPAPPAPAPPAAPEAPQAAPEPPAAPEAPPPQAPPAAPEAPPAPPATPVNLIDAIKAQDKDKVIESLSVRKQNVDSKDNNGKTAIEYAIESMNEDIIDILHEYLVYTDDIQESIAAQLEQAETEKEKIEIRLQQAKNAIEKFTERRQAQFAEEAKILNPRWRFFTKRELSPTNLDKLGVIKDRIKQLDGRIENVKNIIIKKIEGELKAKKDEIEILETKYEFIKPPRNPTPDRAYPGECIHLYGGSDTAFYKVTGLKNNNNYSKIRRMEGTIEIGQAISVDTSRFVSIPCPTASGGDNTVYVIVSSTPIESVIKNFDGTGAEKTIQNTDLVKTECPAPSAPAPSAPAPSAPAPSAPSAPSVPKFKLGECVTLNPAFQSTTEIDSKTKLFLNKITPMITAIDIITGSTANSNYIEYELTHYKKGEKENKVRIQEKYLSSARCPADFLPYKAPPPPEAAASEPARRQPPAEAPVNELARDKRELQEAITKGFVAEMPITQRIAQRIAKILEHGRFDPDPTQFPQDERDEYNRLVSRLQQSADKAEEYTKIMNETQINLIYLLSKDDKKRIVIPRQKLVPKKTDKEENKEDDKILKALGILGLTETSTKSEYTKAYRTFVVRKHPNKGGNTVTFNIVSEMKDKLDEFFEKAISGGSRYGRTRSSRSRRKSATRKYQKRI